ncbi:hypothetical protein KAMAJI_00200 [Serratia phage vB_SmaM-Kamaji]|nr:hypothetical protein KAMAJI_00200 [Serratia phage vB_SmaM-Kamaji]
MKKKTELVEILARLEKEKHRLQVVKNVVGGDTQNSFTLTTVYDGKEVVLTKSQMNGFYTYELDKAYDLVVKGFREGTEALIKQTEDSIKAVKNEIIKCLEEEIKALS